MKSNRDGKERDECMAEQDKDIKDLNTEETVDAAQETAETDNAAEAVEETPTEEMEAAGAETEESDTEETADAEAADGGKEPKSWAEKRAAKKQAKTEVSKEKERIAELEDRVKRQMAEFENFRKRTDKEKQAMFETGARSVIEKILPVVDNFERGFATVDPEDEEDAFVGGMRMVYKQMMTELENIGVKPIEAVGKEFDPNLHNAVMQVASEEYESGIVAQEFIKGYTYRDSVVRHSMVGVVQ